MITLYKFTTRLVSLQKKAIVLTYTAISISLIKIPPRVRKQVINECENSPLEVDHIIGFKTMIAVVFALKLTEHNFTTQSTLADIDSLNLNLSIYPKRDPTCSPV